MWKKDKSDLFFGLCHKDEDLFQKYRHLKHFSIFKNEKYDKNMIMFLFSLLIDSTSGESLKKSELFGLATPTPSPFVQQTPEKDAIEAKMQYDIRSASTLPGNPRIGATAWYGKKFRGI